ncbi:MAG: SusC/RagA family TonB-linked outer membrane protein, partial [Candidatus Azobacteroides sp.]|nr:SusC/RagA family TonB-linked outer membrane protein [Candidatus Azobacteroides sp.]
EVINVTLKESTTKLGEVIVVAFGTQQKYIMTSAVTQIDNTVLKNRPVGDAVAALAGQIAGVNVSQSSGSPGSTASIVVRGVGSLQSGVVPLVIIDGVPGTLSYLDPNDIESVSVLKDAAASSLYGARAANGVILVTTKRAKAGKVAVSYSGYVGWQKPTELFKEANAYDYASAYNLALNYDAITPANTDILNQGKAVYTQAQLDAWRTGASPSTDWRKALFSGSSGFTQSHYLEVSGGIANENVILRNNMSFTYYTQNGNVVNNTYDRYTLRDNSELSWGKFKAGLSVGLMANRLLQPASKNLNVINDSSDALNNIISAVNRQQPMDPIMVDGYYVPTTSRDTNNPVGEAEMGGTWKSKTNNVLLNLNLSYSILKDLVLKASGGLNYTSSIQDAFLNSTTFYNPLTGLTLTNGTNIAQDFHFQEYHYMGQVDLTYNVDFEKHHLGFVVGSQEEYHEYNDWTMLGGNFINNSSNSMLLADPTTFDNQSSQYQWGLIGVFGRINYDFDKKYMIELDARDDGSSRLSPNKRWNFFSAFSVGWRLSQENFWSSLKSVFPEFKIRGSYGQLGSDKLPGTTTNQLYYRDKSLIGNVANDINNGQYVTFNGSAYIPMGLIQSPDNTCTWEKTALTDIAIDGTLLSPDFSYSIDFFNKKTTGMLMMEQLSNINGAGSYAANVGSMKNYGIEFSASYTHTTSYGLKYIINGNYSYLNSKVLDLGGQGYAQVSNQAGYVYHPFYLYQNGGLLTKEEFVNQKTNNPKTPLLAGQLWGDQLILDVTDDNIVNGNDRTVINKNNIPKNLFGLNFDVSLKGLGIAGMIQGAADYYQYLGGSVGYGFNQGYSIATWTIDNSYNPLTNPDNYNTRLPRISRANTINYQYPSTLFLFNSSYVRLKNLQVYYDFSKSMLRHTGISNARLYVSGQNLYTLSALPKALGIDPEVGSSTGSNSAGSATGSYPLLRTWTVGLNVTF